MKITKRSHVSRLHICFEYRKQFLWPRNGRDIADLTTSWSGTGTTTYGGVDAVARIQHRKDSPEKLSVSSQDLKDKLEDAIEKLRKRVPHSDILDHLKVKDRNGFW